MIDRDTSPPPVAGRWDLLGATLATACALHCGLLPLAAAITPLVGSGDIGQETLHRVIAALAPPTAVVAFARGYAAHRRRSVLLLGAIGVALIAASGLTWIEDAPFLEAMTGAAGGALLCAAHLRNRRLCCCGAACRARRKFMGSSALVLVAASLIPSVGAAQPAPEPSPAGTGDEAAPARQADVFAREHALAFASRRRSHAVAEPMGGGDDAPT